MSARRGPWKHVRIGANGHGRRGSAGITMVEMLITIALVSMVLVPVLGWSALAFQSDVSIGTRNQESNGFGLLQTYFARDVAQARTAEKGGTDCNPVGGVDAGIGAGDGGTVVLSLLSRETPVSRTVYSVARSTEDLPSGTTPDSLWRRVCDNTSSVVSEYTEVVPAMKASPVVTCDDSPTSTKCETVKMKVFGPDDDVDDDMTVEAKRNLNVITDGDLTADKNPVAATGTMSPASSTLVTFTAEFNDTDNPAQSAGSYLWDFGDGTDPIDNGASVDLGGGVMGNEITHRFDPDTTDDDTYEVTVVAKTGTGTDSSEDTKTLKIVVDEYDPIAKLDLSPVPARKTQTVVADARGSTDGFDTTAASNADQDASNSPAFDDTIDQYVIEFIDKTKYAADPTDPAAIEAAKTITRAADGTIDTDQTLSHTITTNGTKLARVTVTDQVGKTDSVTKVAVVDEDADGFSPQPPAPDPQFPPNYADCDDADATRYPGAPDPLDGLDQDCNGRDGSDNTLYVSELGNDTNLDPAR